MGKGFFIISVIWAFSSLAYAQQVESKKCPSCGKQLKECGYKGKHAQQPSTTSGQGHIDRRSEKKDEGVRMEEITDENENMIFVIVDKDPEFPGGRDALDKYLAQNIRMPALAHENGIAGRVYVTFVVERDGSISHPIVLKDIGGGCGKEALRVVKSMPRWIPGRQNGKAVRVQVNMPINFDSTSMENE